jgi:hypothetical protein
MDTNEDRPEQPPKQADISTESTPVAHEAMGAMIGRYKLLSVLGEGGFGIWSIWPNRSIPSNGWWR